METLYKVILKNGNEYCKDLNIEQAINFKMENSKGILVNGLKEKIKFDIVSYEVTDEYFNLLKKFTPEEIEKERLIFIKTITTAQQHDIEWGYKEIKFSKELGWYLKIIKTHEDESNFSIEELKHNEKIKKERIIKDCLRKHCEFIFNELFNFGLNEISISEFDEFISKITK